MFKHMRTTVILSEKIMRDAKRLATKRGTTLRALIEEGLRLVTKNDETKTFRLEDGAYGKGGLREGVDLANWESIREAIYPGRGE